MGQIGIRAEMVVVLIGDVTRAKFTVDHYSELSFPFSWPWSHFASSTSIARSKEREYGELLSRMSLQMSTLDL